MIRFYIILSIFLFFSSNGYTTNVVVIDVNFLINNSNQFAEITKKINNSQIDFKKKFKNIEEILYKKKEELEDLKLILSEEEFNLKKNEYYVEVDKFEMDVSDFNLHYEREIINIKNIIFAELSNLLTQYANENAIELIIDKNQYLIASEKINITEKMLIKLNDSKIDLSFKEYEDKF